MKKLLLSFTLLASFSAFSQVEIFSEDFVQTNALESWTLIDADGDGNNWIRAQFTTGPNAGVNVMRSFSWSDAPLTPDNYAYAPAIDLTNYENVTLSWKHMAVDPDWDAEKYNVYVTTDPTEAAATPAAIVHQQATMAGINTLTTVTVDISEFAGQVVYIGFRHFDVTDEFSLEIDDVLVTGDALSTNDFFSKNFAVYPNPANDVINLQSNSSLTIDTVALTDINGRTVATMNANGVSNTTMNIANLSAGVYILNVNSNDGVGTAKIVKK